MKVTFNLPQSSLLASNNFNNSKKYSSSRINQRQESDKVSFKRDLCAVHIAEAKAINFITDLTSQCCVGEKFQSDYLEPAKRVLAENGLMIKLTRRRDEYFSRLIVFNPLSYFDAQARFIDNTNVMPRELGNSATLIYEDVIAATSMNPIKGLSKAHAQTKLIESIHAGVPLDYTRAKNPNLIFIEELPTNFGMADKLDEGLAGIFPHSADFGILKKYTKIAVDILFPSA